jgi:hypothetical protein
MPLLLERKQSQASRFVAMRFAVVAAIRRLGIPKGGVKPSLRR